MSKLRPRGSRAHFKAGLTAFRLSPVLVWEPWVREVIGRTEQIWLSLHICFLRNTFACVCSLNQIKYDFKSIFCNRISISVCHYWMPLCGETQHHGSLLPFSTPSYRRKYWLFVTTVLDCSAELRVPELRIPLCNATYYLCGYHLALFPSPHGHRGSDNQCEIEIVWLLW